MELLRGLFGDDGDVVADRGFCLLLLANVVYPFGALFVSPILESLVGPFGTDPNRVGLLISAYYAPAILVTPFTGLLADRYGRKPLLVWGLVLFGAGGTAIAFTTEFSVALALRFLQGTGGAALLPVVITSIGDLFDGTRESTAQGLRGAVHATAGAGAPLVAAFAILLGWQYPFLLYGSALLIAPVVLLWFTEPTRRRSPDATTNGGVDVTARHGVVRAVSVLRTRGMAATMVAIVVPAFLWTAFLTYNSFVVVDGLGGTPQLAGASVTLGLVVGAVAASQIGRVNAVLSRRHLSPIVAHLLLGVGLFVFVLAESVPVALVGAVTQGCGFGFLVSYYRSVVTRAVTTDVRGTLVGVAETVRGVGVTLPPIVMGLGIEYLSPGMDFLAAVRTVSVVVAIVGTAVGIGSVLVVRQSAVAL